MSVIRIKKAHRKPYVILDTTALLDDRLSYRAKGLHSYLMTKPEDWQVHLDYLAQQSPTEGREAVRTALTELEDAGYVKRQKVRGERGLLSGWNTVVYETPALCTEDILSEAPTTGLPTSANLLSVTPPTTAQPTTGLPTSVQPKSVQPKSVLPTSAKPLLVSMDLTQELILEDPPSVSPPLGGDTQQENLFAHVEGNKNGTRRGNKIGLSEAVYALTGDGTYQRTLRETLLSRDPAEQDRLYRVITDDASFPDWFASMGLTCDLPTRFQDFCRRYTKKVVRFLDWEIAFKDYLVKGTRFAENRAQPTPELPKKKTKADYLAGLTAQRNGGTA
jgi:hypothetical protein